MGYIKIVLKILGSIFIGLVAFFVVGNILFDIMGLGGNGPAYIALLAGFSTIGLCLWMIFGGKAIVVVKKVFSLLSWIETTKDSIFSDVITQKAVFFAQAEQEVLDGDIDENLWAYALVKAKGNEDLRKFEYMKLRVKQIRKPV